MKKIALIPCFEPDKSLIKMLDKLNSEMDIVIVNDGSKDEYNKTFKEAGKYGHVISYPTNKGKGYALKKGIKYIHDKYKKNYIIVTMDCDGQHSVADAKKICSYVEKNPDVLALGKRVRNSTVSLRSKLGNAITKFVYKLSTGLDIYDTQTGLRAFSNKLTDYMLSIKGNRYEYEMNVLLYLKKKNIKYKEIDIKTIYINNNESSHFNAFMDSVRVYKEILKYSLLSIVCFVLDIVLFAFLYSKFEKLILCNLISKLVKELLSEDKKIPIQKYLLITFLALLLNTSCLLIFNLFLNTIVAKIIVEIIFIFLGYYFHKKM